MIRDGLLALGLLLSTASQLRLPGAPLGVGPGEALLAIWILLALAEMIVRQASPLTPAASSMLIFWTLFFVAQSVGQFVGFAIEDVRDVAAARRTAQAYVLVALLSCLVAAMPEIGARLHRIVRTMVAAGAVSLTLLVAGAYGMVHIPGVEFWVFHRFVGWSTNPNQFALLCTVLVFLSVHLAETAARPGARLLGLLSAVPAAVAGALTRSDSFVLAMLISVPALLGIKLLNQALLNERPLRLRTTAACLVVCSIPAFLVSAAPFAPAAFDKARAVATATMEQNDQAEGRLRLWRDALDVSLEAAMLGMGPGPHLLSKQWKEPPPNKNEAHNTLFDLLTQGGLLAVFSFAWIMLASYIATYKARFLGLSALVLSLFIFSNFHLVVRHPIFWFSIALCLTAADSARKPKDDPSHRSLEVAHRPEPALRP